MTGLKGSLQVQLRLLQFSDTHEKSSTGSGGTEIKIMLVCSYFQVDIKIAIRSIFKIKELSEVGRKKRK